MKWRAKSTLPSPAFTSTSPSSRRSMTILSPPSPLSPNINRWFLRRKDARPTNYCITCELPWPRPGNLEVDRHERSGESACVPFKRSNDLRRTANGLRRTANELPKTANGPLKTATGFGWCGDCEPQRRDERSDPEIDPRSRTQSERDL